MLNFFGLAKATIQPSFILLGMKCVSQIGCALKPSCHLNPMYSSPMLDFREFLQVHGLGKQLAWLRKRIGDSSTFNLGFADNILCS